MDTLSHDFFLILPQVELTLFGLAILVFDFMLGVRDKTGNALFAMMGVFFSGVSLYRLHSELGPDPVGGFTSSIVVDPFFIFFAMIFLIALALVILLSVRYLQIENEHHGEYYALLLFATVGMMFMASGYDLIVQFLGLETMAISFYILAGFLRGQRRSNEAAVKYLLLGAFSSGLLAYGFSLLYGISAMADVRGPMGMPLMLPRTNIDVLRSGARAGSGRPRQSAGLPGDRHRGRRPVLQGRRWCRSTSGRPTCTKARPPPSLPTSASPPRRPASRCCCVCSSTAFWPVRVDWIGILGVVAVASLTIGNLAAITQTNVKRMLAYSSISHAGYILLGLVAALIRTGRKRHRPDRHRLLSVRLRLHDRRRLRRHHRAAAQGSRSATNSTT